MSLISRWFGGRAASDRSAPPSGFAASTFQPSAGFDPSGRPGVSVPRRAYELRVDLLRVALRDLSARCGIPSAWLEVRALAGTIRGTQELGVHARLALRHWQPLILDHAPTLERLFMERVTALDPDAQRWLLGVCWQLALREPPAEQPLPPAVAWTAVARRPAPAAAARPGPDPVDTAFLIQSQVRIGADPVTSQLDALLAQGDHRYAHVRGSAPTEPAPLS